MSIMEQILQAIEAENTKAEREMQRAALQGNRLEFSYRQGETIALAKCRAWIESAFKSNGVKEDAGTN